MAVRCGAERGRVAWAWAWDGRQGESETASMLALLLLGQELVCFGHSSSGACRLQNLCVVVSSMFSGGICVRSRIGASSYKFYATTNFADTSKSTRTPGCPLSPKARCLTQPSPSSSWSQSDALRLQHLATGLWLGHAHGGPSFRALPRPEDPRYYRSQVDETFSLLSRYKSRKEPLGLAANLVLSSNNVRCCKGLTALYLIQVNPVYQS